MSELLRHGLTSRTPVIGLTSLGYESRVQTSTAFGDLVAWVQMDGGPPTDTTGNLAPGVVIGGVSFVAGALPDVEGQVVADFNGTSGYLSFADDADLHLSAGAIHFALDIDAFPPLNDFRQIITKEGLGLTDQDFVITLFNNAGVQELRANFVLTGGGNIVTMSGITLGRHWVTVNFGNAQPLELFVDALSRGTAAGYTVGINTNLRTMLAGAVNLGAGVLQFFDGRMAHLQVYNRRLTQAEVSHLSFPSFGGGGGGGSVLQEILNRSPKVYFPLDGQTAADLGSAGLSVTETGTVSKASNGWTMASGAFLQIPHSAQFETWAGAAHTWVDSEVMVTAELTVTSLASAVQLLSKNSGGQFANGWWVTAETNGSLTWRNSHARLQVDVLTPPGTIQANVPFHLALVWGRRGVQMYINANSCEDGWPRAMHYYGWDHLYQGNSAVVGSDRWVNNHPLRVGHNSFTASGNVRVKHLAVFVRGGSNANPFTRTGVRWAQADVTAIAGVAPTAPVRSRHHNGNVINVATSDNIHTRFASAAAGDVLVLAAGTHTATGNLTLPSGVRIVGAGATATTIQLPAGSNVVVPAPAWALQTDNTVDLAAGDFQWTLAGHSVAADDIIILISNIWHGTDVNAGVATAEIPAAFCRCHSVSVDGVSGSVLTFKQPLLMAFADTARINVARLRPTFKHVAIENLRFRGAGTAGQAGPSTSSQFFLGKILGSQDLRLRNVQFLQTGTLEDFAGVVFDCCVELEMQGCKFDTAGTEPTTGADSTHPYVVQIFGGCGYLVYQDCEFDSEGWTAVDRGANNSGAEFGTGTGPAQQILPLMMDSLDCRYQMTRGNGPGVAADYAFVGHHARYMRDICMHIGAAKGVAIGNNCGGNTEKTGIDAGDQALAGNGSRWSYVHWFRARSATDNKMYRNFGGQFTRDSVFSEVRHTAAGYNAVNVNTAQYVNCTYVNCDTPHP